MEDANNPRPDSSHDLEPEETVDPLQLFFNDMAKTP
ncbi:MAG: hypothetical protein QOF30_2163, partial [Acidimicrobiaceae bacterium]|nr:hypothetical protein [Acidimicrobiaceae bacterium]